MRVLALLALSALLLWADAGEPGAYGAQAKAKKKAEPTPWSTVVRAHFSAWDANDDGKLTVAEIEAAMLLPRYKGDAAAALATLKYAHRYLYEREEKVMPPWTLKALEQYERTGLRPKEEDKHEYDRVFKMYQRKLAVTPRALFPGDAPPSLHAIKQGDIGDCWFMCVIAAYAKLHPDKVRGMIEPKDKGYIVRFAGRANPVFVMPPTDAEIALYTSAEKNGLWLTVIEKAFAKTFQQRENPKDFKKARGKRPLVEALEGGEPADAIAILTGFSGDAEDWDSPRLKKLLRALVTQKCLISTWLRDDESSTPGLWDGHAYAVIGYDPKGDRVTLLDPLGDDFTPEGKAGLKNGYEIRAGILTVPFKEFRALFDGITYENRTSPLLEAKGKKGKN